MVATDGALLALDEDTGGTEEETTDAALEDGALDDAGTELITLDTALELAAPVALYTSNSAIAGAALASTYKLIFFMLTVPRLTTRFAPMALPVDKTSSVS